ncbi:hypothetical protein ACEPAI_3928 [Sanghuangporus weigelae]
MLSRQQQAAPDTRLPFKGSLAFDRNAQEYIPFRTETDAMLASLMLAYRLASPVLAVVLALVRHPSFNPADITLSRPEDVWARVAEHSASKRPQRVSGFPAVFPSVVLHEVLDILGEERRTALHVQRDTDGPQLGPFQLSKLDRDLRNMSLVCKDWRQPAQRTLGKILILQDARRTHIVNALTCPLFGPWTTESLIFRRSLGLDDWSREELNKYAAEVWDLMAKLVERTPNVRYVSFCTDWFELPFNRLAENLAVRSLEELRLIQVGDITQLLGAVCKQIKRMPRLRHLFLQYSGQGSAYTNFIPQSELDEGSPGPSLEKVTLKIGSASALSLRYINWLTHPRDGENAFRLKSLVLDLSNCYYSEHNCVEALEPCFTSLSELCVTVSGLSDGVLERIFRSCHILKDLTMVIQHSFDNKMSLMPDTVERACVIFSFEQPNWALWNERMERTLTQHCPPRLRYLRIHMIAYSEVDLPLDPYASSRAIAKQKGIDVEITWSSIRNSGCTSRSCLTFPMPCIC